MAVNFGYTSSQYYGDLMPTTTTESLVWFAARTLYEYFNLSNQGYLTKRNKFINIRLNLWRLFLAGGSTRAPLQY